jgi:tetratricopeptide (TPR) repeat protein
MTMPPPRRSRRSSRPWIVPPGLLVQSEPFEGFHVLDELRSELGLLLWQSLRDVDMWAQAEPEERGELFTAEALALRMERVEQELVADDPARTVVEGLAGLLAAPGRLSPREVSELCEATSRWASDAGLPRTALAFATRAAMAAPDEAAAAYLVGLISRRAADYRRAEVWFRRALALARHNHDWRVYALAHAGIAHIHMQRGHAPKARARLLKALRAARRYGIWSVRSIVLHDLFAISATGPDPRLAEHYARAAFRSYGRRHPRLPVLAHDIARFWMSQGHYDLALATFQAVLPHLTRPPEHMLGLSNLAQAAGGAGEAATFTRAWNDVWRMIDERDDTERVAEALINLAHGAASLGQVVRMDMAASYALTVATRRNEAQQKLVAEQLLHTARHPGHRGELEPVVVEPEPTVGSDLLAEQLVEALMEAVDR